MEPTPAPHEVTTGHAARTSGAVRLQQRNVELAPFSRSDCWKVECRERFSPYLTIKVYLGTAEPVVGEPIFISAVCCGWFGRPADLTDAARGWLWGQP